MKSTVEPSEGNKVKLEVTVEESELEPAVDAAWKQIAKEVKLPGFRPGKAPRKLLERQLGSEYARSEALNSALPEFYSRAVVEHDVDVIASPELEITAGETEGPVSFEAMVEVRPVVELEGYGSLRVELPPSEADDDMVSEQIDRLRGQFGELTDVERDVVDGDYVTIDISGSVDGEPVEGLTADDYLYLVGSKMVVPELDEHILGASIGDTITFESDHPDPEQGRVIFEVNIKGVKERVLPELTDEWVSEATEFDTVQELIEDTRSTLSEQLAEQVRQAVRNNLGAELAKLVEDDIPESLVSNEMQNRLSDMTHRLSHSGLTLDQYLQMTGQDPETFVQDLRAASEVGSRVDLALRAVAVAEGLAATDEELEDEIALMIGDSPISIEEATEQLRSGGQLSAVRSEITKRKALEWLVERSEFVDPDGNPVPAELLEPQEPDEHDHDHGHDHDEDPQEDDE